MNVDGPEQRFLEHRDHYEARREAYEHELHGLLTEIASTPVCLAQGHWRNSGEKKCFACGEDL